MPRPQTDIDAGRKLLLETMESLIQERGAIDISMTELATQAGMSPSNIYRFFESKEVLFEAVAEGWFADKVKIMEEVVASDMPVRDKLYNFFARRFLRLRAGIIKDPELFRSHCELGNRYFEVVKSYFDLGDHYLALIVAEAMEEGYFTGLSIDEAVSLINQMVTSYCSPNVIQMILSKLSEEKLGIIIDTILAGLKREAAPKGIVPEMRVVS